MMAGDITTDVLGTHPFPVVVCFGDERARAYLADARGNAQGPGVQVLTPVADLTLSRDLHVTAADLDRVAQRLGTQFPFLLNVACQASPGKFSERMRGLAAAAGAVPVDAREAALLDGLKRAVDEAQAIGPRAIVGAAMGYLSAPLEPGGPAYGRLVDHVNHVLTNAGNNPRLGPPVPAIAGVTDIGPDGIQLWWVKEGSATIVFQVRVALNGPRPAIRFVLNVSKDLSTAAGELRRNHSRFVELHRRDPASVMEPLGCDDVRVDTWRGTVSVAVLAGEWFDGHELHVYEDSSRLHVWMDQHMGREHPLPAETSDRIWEHVTRMRARLTRFSPAGVVPIATHVNAGDYIFRQKPDGEWEVLLIWMREPPAGVDPVHYVVLAGMLGGVNVFGSTPGKTMWWDQPARALDALCAGLMDAGLDQPGIDALLRKALHGPFTEFEEHPERLPYSTLTRTADPDELRAVFRRARAALAARLGR